MTETTPSPSAVRRRAAPRPPVVLFFVGAALAAVPSLAGGQTTPVVQEGSRVRVTAPTLGLSQMVGRVQEAREEMLVVRFGHREGPETIQRSAITEMEVYTELDRELGKKVGVGFGLGASVGALIGLAQGDDPPGLLSFSAGDKAVLFGLALGTVGMGIGLIAGLSGETYQWLPVTPAGADLTILPLVAPEGTGVYVGLSIPIR